MFLYLSSLYCFDFSRFVSWQTVNSRIPIIIIIIIIIIIMIIIILYIMCVIVRYTRRADRLG